MRTGWFPTGDVGSIDADGYLYFVDRASAAMHVNGAVVYPATIERAIRGIAGLTDAAAVDVHDRIVAAIVASEPPDTDRIIETLRSRLEPHEVPSEIRVLTKIPRNAAGKVRRDDLRDALEAAR